MAVVFASDNYGHEEADNAGLNLPGNQDALIAAVAAANPRTVVVLNNNAAILMPWLNQVAAVFEGFYDGQGWGKAIAALLFGDANPSGNLPVTVPHVADRAAGRHRRAVARQRTARCSTRRASTSATAGTTREHRPAVPVRLRAVLHHVRLQQPARRRDRRQQATVTATVTNTGSRAGAEVAQLYVGHPAANGEPPHQLQGFQRVSLNPGASATVTFTLPMRAFAHWDTASGAWVASAGTYQILVGDSSRNLPLSGTETVPATVTVPIR